MTRFYWILALFGFIGSAFLFDAARGAMHETTSAVVWLGAVVASVGAGIHGVLRDILIAVRGQYVAPTPEEVAKRRKEALLLIAAIALLVIAFFMFS